MVISFIRFVYFKDDIKQIVYSFYHLKPNNLMRRIFPYYILTTVMFFSSFLEILEVGLPEVKLCITW